jgi:hypothetical protein
MGDTTGAKEPPAVWTLADETGQKPPAGQAKIRFVHAAPGVGPLDVGLGMGASFSALATNVPFHTAAQILGKTYADSAPVSHAPASARKTGVASDLSSFYVDVPADAIRTTFFIGREGSTATPLGLLMCADNAPVPSHLGACSLAAPAP